MQSLLVRLEAMAIAKYFEGKQILVTGATGLMGKALVEKLLRCCPGVSKIYIVIRPKRGHRPEDRWTETIQSPLFDYLRNKSPESLSKVVVLAGDGGKDNFGLSEEDRNLLTENVNIVYNFAASINFFNDITRAIEMNLKSAYSLLELGLKMKKLECYVHVSTQFCHFDVRGVLNEKVYEPHLDWRTMLELIKDEKQKSALQLLESRILGGHLSTYTLTKALAEMAVKEYEKHFPTIIVRPAVVGGTANDPMPGWLDVDNFVTLYCRGVRMGVIRILPNSEDIPIESIPLDLSVNGMIVAAWKRSTLPNKECEVYCHRVEDTHRLKLKDITNTIQISRKYPPIHTLWYNFFVCVSNPTLYKIGFFFLHIIPGILIDAALKLSGQKPRMKKIYTDIWRYNALSQYLQNPHHKFVCTNFNKLESFLSHEDKKYFSMDYSGYDFTKIITETVWTTLKYAWKENIDDEKLMAKARSRYRVLTILHYTMCAGLALFLLYLTSSLLG